MKRRMLSLPPYRARRQWILFGVALGAATAAILSPQTGWIARRELGSGLPWNDRNIDQIASCEFAGYEMVSAGVLDAADRYTRSHRDDVAVQVANCKLRLVDETPAAVDAVRSQVVILNALQPDDDAVTLRLRPRLITDVQEIARQNPGNPLALAALINLLTERPAHLGDSIDVQAQTKSQVLMNREGEYLTPAELNVVEQAAIAGAKCDPHNAMFHCVLSTVYLCRGHSAAAMLELKSAALSTAWNDYSVELSGGWRRLDAAVYGGSPADVDRTRDEVESLRISSWPLVTASMAAVTPADALQRAGHYRDGVAIRLDVARLGMLYLKRTPNDYRRLLRSSVYNPICISAFSPYRGAYNAQYGGLAAGASPLPTSDAEYVEDETRFVSSLHRSGFTREADWYGRMFAFANSPLGGDQTAGMPAEPHFAASHLWAAGYFLLSEIALAVLVGVALAVVVYNRRFKPERNVSWSATQWACVFGGAVISIWILLACMVFYRETSGVGLAIYVAAGIVAIQTGLRKWKEDADSPIPLMLNSICVCAGIYVALSVSSAGLRSYLGLSVLMERVTNLSYLNSGAMAFVPISFVLLLIPAVVTFGIFAANRARYRSIPSGIYYGVCRAMLPVLSLLLFGWVGSLLVTGGMERYDRARTAQELGIPAAADPR